MEHRADATRDRLLRILKTRGPQTAAALAERLGVSAVASRQHLTRLAAEGLVAANGAAPRPGRTGRPPRTWVLTAAGEARFPASYGDLALDLLAATQDTYGVDGLQRLVAGRTARQAASYLRTLPPAHEALARRVAALARQRNREGYMAESRRARDGSFVLVQSHCPISSAAEACPDLCSGELELFRRALGPRVAVERTEHLLAGDRRGAYRFRSR